MSRLDVNTLRHTAGSADNITLDNSQNATVEGNLTVDGTTTLTGAVELPDDTVDIADLSATGTASATTFLRGDNAWAEAGGGKVLKIQWNHHGGQGSTTSSSYTEVRHSSAFTPTAADSNLIVLISTSIGNDVTAGNGGNANYRITSQLAGSADTPPLGPDPVWNRYGKSSGDGGYHGEYVTFSYVYECTSTTAVTFNIEAKSQDGPSHPHVGGRVSDNYYAIGALFTIIEVEG